MGMRVAILLEPMVRESYEDSFGISVVLRDDPGGKA
jgi:hypothetical protein